MKLKLERIKGSQTLKVSSRHIKKVRKKINEKIKKYNNEIKGEEENKIKEVEKNKVADIALAVGLKENKDTKEREDSTDSIKMESLDEDDKAKILLERKYPEKSKEELKRLLNDYLEGGMRELAKNIDKNVSIEYNKYIS